MIVVPLLIPGVVSRVANIVAIMSLSLSSCRPVPSRILPKLRGPLPSIVGSIPVPFLGTLGCCVGVMGRKLVWSSSHTLRWVVLLLLHVVVGLLQSDIGPSVWSPVLASETNMFFMLLMIVTLIIIVVVVVSRISGILSGWIVHFLNLNVIKITSFKL